MLNAAKMPAAPVGAKPNDLVFDPGTNKMNLIHRDAAGVEHLVDSAPLANEKACYALYLRLGCECPACQAARSAS